MPQSYRKEGFSGDRDDHEYGRNHGNDRNIGNPAAFLHPAGSKGNRRVSEGGVSEKSGNLKR